MRKVTKKDYIVFRKECLRLQTEWGLLEWSIYTEHKPLEGKFATIVMDNRDMTATITLGVEEFEKSDPKIHAKHEMVHLLLAPLGFEAQSRYTEQFNVEQAEEAIVNKLVKLLSIALLLVAGCQGPGPGPGPIREGPTDQELIDELPDPGLVLYKH